jgi:crotonobetainyl-CoA:carnitine CoA-transferase CaiB-like acyl-CoA transferase
MAANCWDAPREFKMPLLQPYRALDLTDEKGVFCGKLLADLGADVIQIEPPGGNRARRIPPFYGNAPGSNNGLYWLAYGAGKRSVTLDLETETGKERFKKLAENADFVIESFPGGYLDKIGLGYESLREINPGLIMGSITPFGQAGPYKDYKGGDLVAGSMGGMVYCTGEPDRPPLRISSEQAYCQAGVHAAIGLLIALFDRSISGQGQHVDVSMQASMVRTLHTQLPFWEYNKHIIERAGVWRFRGGVATREIWPCRDGFVSWMFFGGAVGMQLMKTMIDWMRSKGLAGYLGEEVEDWSSLDLAKVSPDRIKSWEKIIGDFFLAHTKAQLYKEALERRVSLTPVNAVSDVVHEEQLDSRDFWIDVDYPRLGKTIRYPGPMFKTTEKDCTPSIRGPAPLPGEHDQQVLVKGIGVTEAVVEPRPSVGSVDSEGMALAKVNVLDFSWAFAGPFIGAYLGDYGAQVIKVETHSRLDVTRVSSPYKDGITGVDRAGAFPVANSSKYGLTLDWKHPRAREILDKLVNWADVVVENFGAGVMERQGLGYEAIRKIKPDIIMLSSTIQGQTGPRRSFVGWGWNAVALTGIANLTGWPDRSPVGTIQAYPDSIVPWFGTVAVLSALDYHRRTGKGQYIDISQYETTAHFLAPLLLDYTANGHEATRAGNRSPYAAPHAVYRCKGNNRWCAITVFSEDEWQSFCRVLGSPVSLADSKFSTVQRRKANEDELDRLVEAWTVNYSPEEVMTKLQQAGVPAGVVKSNKEVFEDPQLAARHYFQPVQHREIGQMLQQAWPIELSRSPRQTRPAPCLGEHNEYVCTKILGLSDAQFVDYLNSGVFE